MATPAKQCRVQYLHRLDGTVVMTRLLVCPPRQAQERHSKCAPVPQYWKLWCSTDCLTSHCFYKLTNTYCPVLQVCPANWKPGAASIKPDAEKSMEYFSNAGTDTAMAEATKLTVISTKKEFDSVLASDKPVVIDYMASWCGKCSMIAPYLEELAVSPSNCIRDLSPFELQYLAMWVSSVCNAMHIANAPLARSPQLRMACLAIMCKLHRLWHPVIVKLRSSC